MAGHYWNPTNYENDEELTIPEELRKKVDKTPYDNIDVLYHSINKAYPWCVYAPRRWF